MVRQTAAATGVAVRRKAAVSEGRLLDVTGFIQCEIPNRTNSKTARVFKAKA